MILYHGSYMEIKQIDLSKCEPYKDFGQGFYTTNIRKQAEAWAAKQGKTYKCDGFITGFKLASNVFEDDDYKTRRFSEYSDEWFEFVIKNRDRSTKHPIHEFDIVEGPIADDKISADIEKYIRGSITKECFFQELTKYPEITHQICFCTTKSLRSIERIDLVPLSKMETIGKFVISCLIENDKLTLLDAQDLYYDSGTYGKLSNEASKLYMKSWQEIYEILQLEISDKTGKAL